VDRLLLIPDNVEERTACLIVTVNTKAIDPFRAPYELSLER
jgi:hypothetical protein